MITQFYECIGGCSFVHLTASLGTTKLYCVSPDPLKGVGMRLVVLKTQEGFCNKSSHITKTVKTEPSPTAQKTGA